MTSPRGSIPLVPLLLAILLLPTPLQAGTGHGVKGEVWLILALILLAARLGGELATRLGQPPVLGELMAGIVLGNLEPLGVTVFSQAAADPILAFAAELGVVLLLFSVGLESTVSQMRKVAPQSGLVAVLGVVAPMLLGTALSRLLLPTAPLTVDLFIGATLCATSVGITARVVRDLKAGHLPEIRIVLGAAVIDDVLGLIVLAVVSAVAMQGTLPGPLELTTIIGLAFGFLVGALLVGTFVTPGVYRVASRLRTDGVLGALSVGLCLLLAGISAVVGLAAIVGAFAAGLILDEVHVRPFGEKSLHTLEEYVLPIVSIFAPIFFVRTGMQVNLAGATGHTLLLAGALLVAAVAGKLVSGWGVRGKELDRLAIGLGMIPRGEVGLIFADAGARIVNNGRPLIDDSTYVALVLMVMVTTIITPPALAIRLKHLVASRPPSEAQADPTLELAEQPSTTEQQTT